MGKTFRFLLSFAWVNLGAIIGFAAIVTGGCYITGVPYSPLASNLFVTYYAMFPALILLCLFLYAFALCTTNLNMGLSMGARRNSYFWALQGIMVFYAAVCWVLQWLMSVFPAAASWVLPERFGVLFPDGRPWIFPLLCIVTLVLGCLGGLLMVKNKILGMIVIIISTLIMMGITIVLILSSQTDLFDFVDGPRWAWLAVLPKVMAGVLAASFAGGELLIWHSIQRCVVR